MASKHLLFKSEARERVLSGANALADAVRVTLGPKSMRSGSGIIGCDGARGEYVDLVKEENYRSDKSGPRGNGKRRFRGRHTAVGRGTMTEIPESKTHTETEAA